jgi:hypothetical protein
MSLWCAWCIVYFWCGNFSWCAAFPSLWMIFACSNVEICMFAWVGMTCDHAVLNNAHIRWHGCKNFALCLF